MKLTRVRALALLLPFAIHLAGVALLGDWIIDDAGISYAYARNVAAGHGFVSQPGRPPVEGFSNFLWVVLMVPLFVVRAFHPIWVPKVMGALCVLGAFAVIQRALRRATGNDVEGLLCTLLLAASPPIVIWTASGLENGLTMLLVAVLFALAVDRPPGWRRACGAAAGLLAMTRPDGVLFAGLGFLIAIVELARKRPAREALRDLGANLSGLALVLVPFLLLRFVVFGRALPHTYYAKRLYLSPWDPLAAVVSDPNAAGEKLADLCRGTFGPAGPALVALTAAGALVLAVRRRLPRHAAIALGLQAIAIFGFVWMDPDWMGEYRFATGAVLASMVAFVAVGVAAAREVAAGLRLPASRIAARARLHALPLAGAVLVALALATFFPRIATFAANPPTPFADVERSFARKLDAYADGLGIARGSVLLPDVGAMLHGSRLLVYDAAGLCEPDVIHTLKKGTTVWLDEHPEFYDHVFEELRPTFISTHHFWTLVTAFDDDPRFVRDYVAIDAYEDAYVKSVFGRRLRSGDFVRRDALADFGRLDQVRAAYRPAPRPEPLVVRLAEALSDLPPHGPPSVADLRDRAVRAYQDGSDPHRAAELLGRLLERHPFDAEAAFLRASALDSAVRPDEARREWQRVVDLSSSTSTPYVALARARLAGQFFPPRAPAPGTAP